MNFQLFFACGNTEEIEKERERIRSEMRERSNRMSEKYNFDFDQENPIVTEDNSTQKYLWTPCAMQEMGQENVRNDYQIKERMIGEKKRKQLLKISSRTTSSLRSKLKEKLMRNSLQQRKEDQ